MRNSNNKKNLRAVAAVTEVTEQQSEQGESKADGYVLKKQISSNRWSRHILKLGPIDLDTEM